MANLFAILLLLNGSRQWAGALEEADQQCDVDDRGLHVQAEAVSLLQSNFEVFKLSEADELHRGIQRAHPMALAQTSMGTGKKASALAQSAAQKPLPSGWFGDFSEAESTYDKEGLDSHSDNPEWAVKYGRDPSLPPSSSHAEKFPSHFFQESQSGGPQAAWQTNWPSVKSSVPGMRGTEENPWREEPMGWVQEYRPMSKAVTNGNVGPENANWFDNSMRNVDGFGRKMQPGIDSGQKLFDWVARSVDTTLTCKEVGCLAQSSLRLFDPTTEEATECSLTVRIHPTDYDDDWGRENVEFIKINGYVASRECHPAARGCNSTAEEPLYPCLNDFNVDRVISSDGTLLIESKNSDMVDECPFDGQYLLSGIAVATCMVRNKPQVTVTEREYPPFSQLSAEYHTGVLKCDEPGCTAETHVKLSPELALNGGKCTMDLSVKQTDYDDALGVPEQIEFLHVEGMEVADAKLVPGMNPCNLLYKGENATIALQDFAVLKDKDITSLVKKTSGTLRVTAKISDKVDECDYQGSLLYGDISVTCVPPDSYSVKHPPMPLQPSLWTVAEVVETPPVLLQGSAKHHKDR